VLEHEHVQVWKVHNEDKKRGSGEQEMLRGYCVLMRIRTVEPKKKKR
jgi:hypothetical protein